MGQKVHPKGLRLGIVRDWDAKWFAGKEYQDLLHEDLRVRDFLKKTLYESGIARIEIERAASRLKVSIYTAKPGMVIGRGGTEVDRLRAELEKMTGRQVAVNIIEVKAPELEAQLVAENIAASLERRIAYRRAMKQAAQRTMRAGAKGVKIVVAGRLNGAEIARTEGTMEGSVPLHTLRADVDYGLAEANTTYGVIGVKVWIYRGEILPAQTARKEEGA